MAPREFVSGLEENYSSLRHLCALAFLSDNFLFFEQGIYS